MRQARCFLTVRDTSDRLAEQPALDWTPYQPDDTGPAVLIDDRTRFQTLEGFGGAMTEAAVVTINKLDPVHRAEVLRAYYGPSGNNYALCRSHINSCDFALGNYAYVEKAGDVALETFSLKREEATVLRTLQIINRLNGAPVKLLASPWSPPAWMKTTGQMNGGGKLKPEYRDAWARYYCRYIQELRAANVPVWALTVQNEPEATQRWDSCVYTAEEERDFVRDHLGPALAKEGLGDVKIVIWDHNRDRMYERAKIVYDDPEAAKYVWGTGFHWYCGDFFDNVQRVHDAWPDKQLLFTEGCQEGGPHIGSWVVGERYAHSIINDLNRWTVGWIDWNLALDMNGGPNHVGNYCSAPILCDTVNDSFQLQSSYYYIGHFSRYMRPGAQRIIAASTRDELQVTAFKNPDGTIAVAVLNRSETRLPFKLKYQGQALNAVSPARSIGTYLI